MGYLFSVRTRHRRRPLTTSGNIRARCGTQARPHVVGQSLLGDVLDDAHEFVGAITMRAREGDQVMRSVQHGTTLGRPGDCDPASASKLEEPFVAQRPECASARLRRIRCSPLYFDLAGFIAIESGGVDQCRRFA